MISQKNQTSDSFLERQATLVVGLGGAGGQVVARIKNIILNTFGANSIKAQNVHYLVMDNDNYPNLDGWVRQTIDEKQEFLCLSLFNPQAAYLSYENDPQTMADLRMWFPREDIDLLPNRMEDTGAARCRPLGRFFLYHNRNKARKWLEEAVSRALTGVPEARRLRVIFANSCLGGSGSSALLDVVYMLKLILQEKGKVEGDFYEFVLLPEIFIEAACRKQPAMEPYLKANAFAFFRELDYIQKKPDKLNEWAMDAISAGRTQPGRGLEPHQKPPFSMIYLIDSVIPEGSIGQFASLNDLFDYTATCIYYTMFCEPVFSGFNSRLCNAEGINDTDFTWGRSLRYSAVGVSEIRRPRELLRGWYALEAARDLARLCLEGPEDSPSSDEIQNSFQNLCESIPVFRQLQERMNEIIHSILKKLPASDAYLHAEGKVNWDEATFSNFKSAITLAQNQIEYARPEMAKAYANYLQDGKQTFENGLLAFLNTWGNFRGLSFCKSVLDQYNLYLEGSIPQHLQTVQQKKREADALLQELDEQIKKIKKPLLGEGDNVARIHEFSETLNKYTAAALGAQVHFWLAEFTRVCAGDPEGKDPLLQNVDPSTGQITQAKTPTRSILDSWVDKVESISNELFKLRNRDIHLEFQRELNRRGHSPSSLYLPDIFQMGSMNKPAIQNPYIQAFPAFSATESAQRERFGELLSQIGQEIPEFLDFRLFSSRNSDELGAIFTRSGKKLAREVQLQGKDDLLQAMGNQWKSYMERLNSFSMPALRCTREKLVRTEDRNRIQELVFLGAENKEIIDKAREAGIKIEDERVFTLDEGVVHIRTMSVIPYLISDSLRGLEAAYVYRDEMVRPHFSKLLNNGQLDEEDPLGLHKRPHFETYLKMWALTSAMKNNEKIQKLLTRRLGMKMTYSQEMKEPTFFFFEKSRIHPHYGLNAIYWNIDGYTLTQNSGTPHIHIFNQLFTNWEVNRNQAYLHYAKEYAILECHEEILYLMERDAPDQPDSLLMALYESLKEYAAAVKDSYQKFLQDQNYSLARQREMEHRNLSPSDQNLLDNGNYLQKAMRTLDRLISHYEEHYNVMKDVSMI